MFLLTLDRAARRTSVRAARARGFARDVPSAAMSSPLTRSRPPASALPSDGPRKRPRASWSVDEPDPARRARARAADYDGWLADAKAKWRTLRKKMAVLRNFVKTERDGGATAIAMVRDPLADPFGASDAARLTLVDATGAATAAATDVGVNVGIAGSGDTRRHEGLTRWKRVKPEDVKLGDGLRLQRALVALARLAAANAPPHARNARATSLMVTAMGLPDAPRRDDEDDAREATAAGEDDGDGDARDDAAGRLEFEDGEMDEEEMDEEEMDKEEMEDSEMEDSEMEDPDMEDSDAPGAEPENDDAAGSEEDADPIVDAAPPALPAPPSAPATESARDALAAYESAGAAMPPPISQPMSQPMPPPTSQPTSQPMPLPMPPPPSIAPEHSAAAALAAYGAPDPGDAEASAMASAMEDPWLVCEPVIHRRPAPVGDAEGTEANEGFGAGPETDPGAGSARDGAADGASEIPRTVRPFARDADLDAALNLCEKPWTELTVAETHLILRQVKRLIARRGRGASGGDDGDDQDGVSAEVFDDADDPDAAAVVARMARGKTYSCIACGREFDSPAKLVDHMNEHAGARPHQCDEPGCSATFASRAALRRHKSSHVKRYACDHPGCGRLFPTAFSLASHRTSHASNRPFACDWPECGKRFKDADTLRGHRRTHTGERPFACDLCDKRFGYRVDLTRHRRTHFGERAKPQRR